MLLHMRVFIQQECGRGSAGQTAGDRGAGARPPVGHANTDAGAEVAARGREDQDGGLRERPHAGADRGRQSVGVRVRAYGRLGTGDEDDRTAPTEAHTAAVTAEGQLYTWGWDGFCQLGAVLLIGFWCRRWCQASSA